MNKDLSTSKLIMGAMVMPLLAFICASYPNEQLCVGFFVVLTLIFWVVLYFRIAEMVRSVRGSLPQRQRRKSYEHTVTRPLPPPDTLDDSRSIFL